MDLSSGGKPWESKFVEIVGKVVDEGQGEFVLREERTCNIGDNFNMETAALAFRCV